MGPDHAADRLERILDECESAFETPGRFGAFEWTFRAALYGSVLVETAVAKAKAPGQSARAAFNRKRLAHAAALRRTFDSWREDEAGPHVEEARAMELVAQRYLDAFSTARDRALRPLALTFEEYLYARGARWPVRFDAGSVPIFENDEVVGRIEFDSNGEPALSWL